MLKNFGRNLPTSFILLIDGRNEKQEKTIPIMSEKNKCKDYFIVANEKGLHTRPATELVKCASSYKAQVHLIYQDLTVNAKSMLGILMLAAAKGAKIKVEAEGDDAEDAARAIINLAKNKFNIKY